MESNFVIEGKYTLKNNYTKNVDVVMNDDAVSILSENKYDSFHTLISRKDSINLAKAILKHYEQNE